MKPIDVLKADYEFINDRLRTGGGGAKDIKKGAAEAAPLLVSFVSAIA